MRNALRRERERGNERHGFRSCAHICNEEEEGSVCKMISKSSPPVSLQYVYVSSVLNLRAASALPRTRALPACVALIGEGEGGIIHLFKEK